MDAKRSARVCRKGKRPFCLYWMDDFVFDHPDTRLIVIDTLARAREHDNNTYSYAMDYKDMLLFKEFADARDLCLILVHHTRKNAESANPFDQISGTNGLLGAADGAFVLHREKGEVFLDFVGRDLPEQRYVLEFEPTHCLWEVVRTDVQTFEEQPEPLLDWIAAIVLDFWNGTATRLLHDLKEVAPYNAAKKASPPKNQQKDVNYFQPVQICDILEALDGEPLKWQLITHLLMITGAHRGEIAGLKWSKFDMEKRRLKVDTALLNSTKIGVYETTTKTGNQRYIPLPEETFALLKRYRISQMELQLANGDRWVQTDYVFTQSDGSPIRPDTITQWLAKFSKRKGLPHINPHAFRHTAASVLIAQGTDVVTVSKMLGHTKVSTTEDIYSHVIEDCKQQASHALAEVYFRRKTAENERSVRAPKQCC